MPPVCLELSMALARMSARAVAEMAVADLVDRLTTQYLVAYGHGPSISDQRAWQGSLPLFARDLVDAGLGDVEMLVEYSLPLTSLRADVVLAGFHPMAGHPSYVVVELKQWTHATVLADTPELCTVGGGRPLLNPIEQVRRYCDYITDFIANVRGQPGALAGIAYLHDAVEGDVAALFDLPADQHGQLFTGSSRPAMVEFLHTRLAPKSGVPAADQLLNSNVAPAKRLLSVAAEEMLHQEHFSLLDEQQIVNRLVMRAIRDPWDRKEAIVVSGMPGSGKSTLALHLLGRLYRDGYSVLHATGSKPFTTTLRKIAGKGSTRVQKLFQYFNSFSQVHVNELDVLICDDAHRIRQSSNNRYTPATKRSTKSQVEELLDVARVTVFLLDEDQIVRPGELGTIDHIVAAATDKGITVRQVSLNGQFRSGGSHKYEQWVSRLLSLDEPHTGPVTWEPDGRFDLDVVDAPEEMERLLADKYDRGYTARMTAGFCWPWSDAVPHQPLVDDIVIDDWRRPWTVKGDRSVNGAPPSPLWATDAGGFGQVGSIYVAQGFEYDWNGVIIGPDMRWRTDRWVTDRAASRDSVVARADARVYDRFVRQTYRVLLTRGRAGTVLYATDPETRVKLRQLLNK
jgi:energy-coupling factor transporter ATP-binding protein EcfA2